MNRGLILGAALLGASTMAGAAPLDDLLQRYQNEGAGDFSAARGEQMWTQKFTDAKSGQQRSCATCHTSDLKQTGEHARTGKTIKPLAPSVNPVRLTEEKEMRKWLLRNCKWTVGRTCTAQEKGDLLTYINSQ